MSWLNELFSVGDPYEQDLERLRALRKISSDFESCLNELILTLERVIDAKNKNKPLRKSIPQIITNRLSSLKDMLDASLKIEGQIESSQRRLLNEKGIFGSQSPSQNPRLKWSSSGWLKEFFSMSNPQGQAINRLLELRDMSKKFSGALKRLKELLDRVIDARKTGREPEENIRQEIIKGLLGLREILEASLKTELKAESVFNSGTSPHYDYHFGYAIDGTKVILSYIELKKDFVRDRKKEIIRFGGDSPQIDVKLGHFIGDDYFSLDLNPSGYKKIPIESFAFYVMDISPLVQRVRTFDGRNILNEYQKNHRKPVQISEDELPIRFKVAARLSRKGLLSFLFPYRKCELGIEIYYH